MIYDSQLIVRIPQDLRSNLEQQAQRRGVKLSAVTRQAIKHGLTALQQQQAAGREGVQNGQQ